MHSAFVVIVSKPSDAHVSPSLAQCTMMASAGATGGGGDGGSGRAGGCGGGVGGGLGGELGGGGVDGDA